MLLTSGLTGRRPSDGVKLVRDTRSLRRAEGVPRERAVGREAMKPTVYSQGPDAALGVRWRRKSG